MQLSTQSVKNELLHALSVTVEVDLLIRNVVMFAFLWQN